MENATKALLIAAAVLVVIVLISIGMGLLNSASKPVEQAGTTATTMEVSIHNSQFEQYTGSNVSLAKVKELFRRVKLNNQDLQIETLSDGRLKISDGGIFIKMGSGDGAAIVSQEKLGEYINNKLNAKSYTVEINYSDTWSDGKIKRITVTANS